MKESSFPFVSKFGVSASNFKQPIYNIISLQGLPAVLIMNFRREHFRIMGETVYIDSIYNSHTNPGLVVFITDNDKLSIEYDSSNGFSIPIYFTISFDFTCINLDVHVHKHE